MDGAGPAEVTGELVLVAVLTAAFVATFAVSAVLFAQAIMARAELRAYAQKRAITELARMRGGVVTPRLIATHLAVSVLDADRLLRSMVDDVYLVMDIDVDEGELRFIF